MRPTRNRTHASPTRRFGLADGIGLTTVLATIAYFPWLADPLTYPKLLCLVTGSLILAPFVIMRWGKNGRPAWPGWVILGCVLALLLWGIISVVGSAAPLAVSFFGWWGRGNGWLSWLAAAILLAGAATLTRNEISRVITWLLVGATVMALVGALQALGITFPPGAGNDNVISLTGNTNFAAGYFAITAVLALGTAIAPGVKWRRLWAGSLFLVLSTLAYLTDALQGPAAVVCGILALGIAYALMQRGKYRIPGLIASATVMTAGIALLAWSLVGGGPLAPLWAERTFEIRQSYWQAALNMMNALPFFGTGPDSFARYVSEYRPETYVELVGPIMRGSAAHNIALQFGASLGWVGLILWLALFGGIAVLLVAHLLRGDIVSLGMTATVTGGFAAYLAQGMVSIDMVPLLATGWLLAGLAYACTRRTPETTETPARKEPPIYISLGIPVAAGTLALAGAIAVSMQIAVADSLHGDATPSEAISFVQNPMSPCPLRIQVTRRIVQELPATVSVDATYQAARLDPRCPSMANLMSDIAIQQDNQDLANVATSEGITFDPLLDYAWLLRARYLLRAGDIEGAEAAVEEAQRLQALYPKKSADKTALKVIMEELATARS